MPVSAAAAVTGDTSKLQGTKRKPSQAGFQLLPAVALKPGWASLRKPLAPVGPGRGPSTFQTCLQS